MNRLRAMLGRMKADPRCSRNTLSLLCLWSSLFSVSVFLFALSFSHLSMSLCVLLIAIFCYEAYCHPLSPTVPQSAVLRPQGNDVHMAHDTDERRGGSARLYMAQWDPPRVDVNGVGFLMRSLLHEAQRRVRSSLISF